LDDEDDPRAGGVGTGGERTKNIEIVQPLQVGAQ